MAGLRARPRHTRLLRLRRAVGRARLAYPIKRAIRKCFARGASSGGIPSYPARERTEQPNILLISHCDFTGNSAVHAYQIATELHQRGYQVAIAVPGNPRTVDDIGRPPFTVTSHRDARLRLPIFPNGRGPELVHAFTPRRSVLAVAAAAVGAARCPYLLHLEDNESSIGRAPEDHVVAGAAGLTVVVERLLELKPASVPGVVVWPGFDEAVLAPERSTQHVRAELSIPNDAFMVVYTGNVHEFNLAEVRELYLAIARLRASGRATVLVKTGWNFVPRSSLVELGQGLRDLGWVSRSSLADLLAAADVLVQPGWPNDFNDYRFPSKLPDFLASGRPVVLPKTNIGLHLRDGVEALLLERGDACEIALRIETLARDAELRNRLGEGGRHFALRELRWSQAVDRIATLYALIQRIEIEIQAGALD